MQESKDGESERLHNGHVPPFSKASQGSVTEARTERGEDAPKLPHAAGDDSQARETARSKHPHVSRDPDTDAAQTVQAASGGKNASSGAHTSGIAQDVSEQPGQNTSRDARNLDSHDRGQVSGASQRRVIEEEKREGLDFVNTTVACLVLLSFIAASNVSVGFCLSEYGRMFVHVSLSLSLSLSLCGL